MPTMSMPDGRRCYIDKCPYCGATKVPASLRMQRCDVCARRYAKYMQIKSELRTHITQDLLGELTTIISEYQQLREAGYKVPRGIPK